MDIMFVFIPYLHILFCSSFLGTGVFTFLLQAFYFANHTGDVPNPVALNQILYFKAKVVTQSSASNLDLFIERCWVSKSANDGNFDLIIQG